MPIRQLLTSSNISPTCWLVYIGRSRAFPLLFQSDAGSTVWNVGEGCDESRDCEDPDLYSRGSSVKPGDAINEEDEADDELFKAKLSKSDVKGRERNSLQMRDYMFAQGTGTSSSSLVKIQIENSRQTAAGLRKIMMRGNL